jgi:acetylornithine/N-succinyldiaminopimelate aminotransferase
MLVFDEVQCGLGRTGSLWAHEAAGVTPDLMTIAKPLGGGLPIGAVLMTREIAGALAPGCHGSTFGGNPFVTHVALRVLETIDTPGFLHTVRRNGDMLRQRLEALSSTLILELRGRGLMLGVQVSVDANVIVESARDVGLLVVAGGDDVVRLLPPLNILPSEIDLAVSLLESALANVEMSA